MVEAVNYLSGRPYDPARDENAVVYMWLKSYGQSQYCKARGAHRTHTPEELAYWMEHRATVLDLLGTLGARVICDPDDPDVIWAWACVDPIELAIHYVSIKRSAAKAGFAREIWDALVGDLVDEPCLVTHELVEMRSNPWREAGIRMPAKWYREEMAA